METKKMELNASRRSYKGWRRGLLFLICAAFFVWSFQQIVMEHTIVFDNAIRNTVNGWELSWLLSFFHTFTLLGDKAGVIAVLLLSLILIWWKTKDYAAMGVLTAGVIIVNELNKWLKNFTGRERPMTGPGAESLSFPSGHAMVGVFFYGLLVYFLFLYNKKNGTRLGILLAGIVFIFLLGVSRIFLNYHYPSDVFAGFAAGYLCLLLAVLGYEWIHSFLINK